MVADRLLRQVQPLRVVFLLLADLRLEVGDLGDLLGQLGLILVDLGDQDLALLRVLGVLGLEVGLALVGGVGGDVELALVDAVGRLQPRLTLDIVRRERGGQHRLVAEQVLQAVERRDERLVRLAQVAAGELLHRRLGGLELGARRPGRLRLGDGVVDLGGQAGDLVADLLGLGGDLGLDGFEFRVGPGADLLPQLLVLVQGVAGGFVVLRRLLLRRRQLRIRLTVRRIQEVRRDGEDDRERDERRHGDFQPLGIVVGRCHGWELPPVRPRADCAFDPPVC